MKISARTSRNFFLIFCLLCLTWASVNVAFSQTHLRFYHDELQQEVVIRPGDVVKFEYAGYLRQPEALENRVVQLGDNAIVLGQTFFGNVVPGTQRTILIDDITGFRKFSRLRYTLKAATQIGSAVGSIILFRQVIDRSKLSGTGDILLTFGVGLGSTILVEALFPKRVKRKISQGWRYEIR